MSAPAQAIHRSYLFVPGDRPERFDKACSAGADAVIIDLEDAVAPAEKESAREAIRRWLSSERSVYLRINASESTWFQQDLSLARLPGVAGIVLPKAERADEISAVLSAGALQVLPLVESAQGMWNANQLARQPQVLRLLFGTIDFNVDMGIEGEDDELIYFRSQLVLLSRVAGIQPPVDGVTTDIGNEAQIRSDTNRGRKLGFGGKLCIHPKQVPVVNACFAPSAEQVDWARRVLEAVNRTGGSAIAVDGRMVDRPVILRAQEIVAEAGRRAQLLAGS